jgi:hypothetical protein
MKPISTIVFCSALFFSQATIAQTPFSTIDSVDINRIKATVLVHGDMWWDPIHQTAGCEFPKGAGTHISFAGALWMAGYDAVSGLHVAAQTYRQNGNDYWPGPLDSTGTLSYATSQAWAKIWKVNRTAIDSFNALNIHTTTNTPAPILQWPAKGNPYAAGNGGVPLNINKDLAPFVDVNNDGIYNPLQGDYPAIKGDQTLWWLFSDNGPKHNETNGQPLKVEVQAMAYAYNREGIINNVVYYEYTMINKSTLTYTNFRAGLWDDIELGYAYNDYLGFDSSHRMGICYNGTPTDGTSGQAGSFGNMIPTVGVSILESPGDNGTNYVPAGSFMYYTNTSNPATGNPAIVAAYNNSLRSSFADGSHLKHRFSGADCNYAFDGDPSDSAGWSECASGDLPDDRRFVLASNDFTFTPGGTRKIAFALITTNPMLNNGCPSTNFDSIKIYADTVWAVYKNPLINLGVTTTMSANTVHIYPNPAHDKLFIDNLIAGSTITVYNMLGQVMNIAVVANNKIQLSIAGLPSGVYMLRYSKDGVGGTERFVKD